MPFTHHVCGRFVLFHYLSELSPTDHEEVRVQFELMRSSDDGEMEAMNALGILAVGDIDDSILNDAKSHRLKAVVERACAS